LLTLARRLCKDERLVERGATMVCACSGGPDSTAMLHALARMRSKMGHRLLAVGVDHGLRPEAAGELELVASLARAEEVPFEVVTLRLEPGSDLQARARRARYGALRGAAERANASCIAVGHTADDRAETLVMRLLRGAGPRG
jgi:tRNA(Ile)-lysidine synthase